MPGDIDWRLFAQQALRPFIRRMAAGRLAAAAEMLGRDSRAILRQRLWPDEARVFGDHLERVLPLRRSLFLQSELIRSNAKYRAAIERHGLRSKLAFARFCAAHAFAHPPTVPAAQVPLTADWGDAIFLKPDRGSSGKGVAVMRRLADGTWQRTSCDSTAVGDLRAVVGQVKGLIAQPLLQSHPDIPVPEGAALATVRVVTGRTGDGDAAVLSALAELPQDPAQPLAMRWISVPIDLRSGELLPGDRTASAMAPFAYPAAAEMFTLAATAHRLLAGQAPDPLPPMIGWDLAATPAGAVLLEANWNWAVAPHYCNAAGLTFDLSPIFERYASGRA